MKLLKLSVLVCSAFLVFAGCSGEPSVSEEEKKKAQNEMKETMTKMTLPQSPKGAPGAGGPGAPAPAPAPAPAAPAPAPK
jgi:PBP1b-binding outer membrane lipoprotein LpoB